MVLASGLRLYGLGETPNGLFVDEASTGYDAYSLLETGRDQFGKKLPLFAQSLGDYNEALYRYLVIPPVYLFGLNEFSVRLPAALAGILTVLSLFVLVRRLFGTKVALWAALFLALSPWHIHFSRIAFRGVLLPLFVTSGLAALAIGFGRKGTRPRPAYMYLAALLFVGSLFTYSSARVFVPLLLAGLACVSHIEVRAMGKHSWIAGGVFLLGVLVLLPFWLSPEGMARADAVNLKFSWGALRNYSSYFGWKFLVTDGDPSPRHGVQGMGQLYMLDVPLLIVGAFTLLRRGQRASSLWLFVWLLLFPLPGALTAGSHALRSLVGVPAFCIVSAVGASAVCERFRSFQARAACIAILLAGIGASSARYVHTYHTNYSTTSAPAWLTGMGDLVAKTEAYQGTAVFISNQVPLPFLYLPFYLSWPPGEYQELSFTKDPVARLNGYQLGRYHIVNFSQEALPTESCLLVGSHSEFAPWEAQLADRIESVQAVIGPEGQALYVLITLRE
ncbi:MAG: phospholipid carrier-dependent glycosyltransferase [bacterium]|nr:phospholipid carrier-dependent glycosyltransferase [bacterium]